MDIMELKALDGEQLGGSIVEQTLAKPARVGEILASQTTAEESGEYVEWVLGIAKAGCQAVGSGSFGLSGEAVTPAEDQYIKDLSRTLVLDPL